MQHFRAYERVQKTKRILTRLFRRQIKTRFLETASTRVYFLSKINKKNNHHSVLELNRRTIASCDIALKPCEQQSGNFSNNSLNQDLNPPPYDYKPNTTSSELYAARSCFYVHKPHE